MLNWKKEEWGWSAKYKGITYEIRHKGDTHVQGYYHTKSMITPAMIPYTNRRMGEVELVQQMCEVHAEGVERGFAAGHRKGYADCKAGIKKYEP